MTFILPSFGASVVSAVPGGGASPLSNTYSLSFDGVDDYLDLGSSTFFNTSSAFSYSGWVKLDSYTPAYQTISQFKTNHSNGFVLMLSNTGNYTGLNIGSNDTSNMMKVRTAGDISSTFLNWTHIAMTYSGSGASTSSNYKTYINGSEVSTTSSGNLISFNNVNSIGSANAGATFPTNGLIDEVAIFNAELSSSDVTAIYNSGVPASLTSYSPLAWYRNGDNDSGTGTTVTDQGSGGNNATLKNGAAFSTTVPS